MNKKDDHVMPVMIAVRKEDTPANISPLIDPADDVVIPCPDPDCEGHKLSEILPQIKPEHRAIAIPQIKELAARLKADPMIGKIGVELVGRHGLSPANPFLFAAGGFPYGHLEKDAMTGHYVKVYRIPGDPRGEQRVEMDGPVPDEFKSECAAVYRQLAPELQFAIVERMIGAGIDPADFGCEGEAAAHVC